MSFLLTGKTAIVTGSAHGIGRAVARHFLAQGANVMFADHDEEALMQECGIEAGHEGPLRAFAGDLSEKLSISNLLSATIDAFDRVDILVNANRHFATSDPLDAQADAVEMLWQQNLLSSLRMSQMTAKRMILQAERAGDETELAGTIINLSSLAARRTQPGMMGYSIACAAIEQMTRSLAVELAPKRIRVNAIAFASVMSSSLQGALRDQPTWREAMIAATPMGRIAAPESVAETAQYLASDAASFVTGQVITLDGGRGLLDPVLHPAH